MDDVGKVNCLASGAGDELTDYSGKCHELKFRTRRFLFIETHSRVIIPELDDHCFTRLENGNGYWQVRMPMPHRHCEAACRNDGHIQTTISRTQPT